MENDTDVLLRSNVAHDPLSVAADLCIDTWNPGSATLFQPAGDDGQLWERVSLTIIFRDISAPRLYSVEISLLKNGYPRVFS